MLLNSVAIGFASSAPDPGALRAVLQQVVDQQALAWNASFSLGLVYGAVAESVAVAGGLSDHATGTVVTPSTRYPLGSATKLHTSIACLQAAERGLLDLDAPIAQYVDPFLGSATRTAHGSTRICFVVQSDLFLYTVQLCLEYAVRHSRTPRPELHTWTGAALPSHSH